MFEAQVLQVDHVSSLFAKIVFIAPELGCAPFARIFSNYKRAVLTQKVVEKQLGVELIALCLQRHLFVELRYK